MSISLSKSLLLDSLTTQLAEAEDFAETFYRYLMEKIAVVGIANSHLAHTTDIRVQGITNGD